MFDAPPIPENLGDVKSRRKTTVAGRRSRIPVLLVVTYTGVLLLAPLIAVGWGAFQEGFGRAFAEVMSPDARHAIFLTVLLAALATLINLLFGVCIAWVLVRDHFPGKSLLNALVDLPFAVSPVIAGLMLILLYGRDGWLHPVLDRLGIQIVFAIPGMLVATMFVSLPFVIREVVPVLRHLGTRQEEAAYTLGASAWQTFWRITLPSIKWGLLYGVSLTFARALGEFGAVLVVSGSISGLTETSTLFIFRTLDDRNYTAAYAMALVLAIFSFSIFLVIELAKRRVRGK